MHGQWFEVTPWIPTACPGSQLQMATSVLFRVSELDSFAECVLGLGRQFHKSNACFKSTENISKHTRFQLRLESRKNSLCYEHA